jgi:glycerol kinase
LLSNNSTVAAWNTSGELALGTIDSFLMYRLSGNRVHLTDHTNASRTMLYGLSEGDYQSELLHMFGVSRESLPEIRPSVGLFTTTRGHPLLPDGIPIMGCLGDQQAALFGHRFTARGEGKITFGTGSFLLSPVGDAPLRPQGGLLCSVAMSSQNTRTFALEGSVFVAASSLQYLRDKFGWMKDASESEVLALSDARAPEVQVIPAFTGFGAPYWNPKAKAAILGLSLGTSRAQVIRAALEAIALQNVALVKLMAQGAGTPITRLGVDGGASQNNLLMQFQADVLGATISRPLHSELTALGAARAALRGLGHPGAEAEPKAARIFTPQMEVTEAASIVTIWQRAADAINALYS